MKTLTNDTMYDGTLYLANTLLLKIAKGIRIRALSIASPAFYRLATNLRMKSLETWNLIIGCLEMLNDFMFSQP